MMRFQIDREGVKAELRRRFRTISAFEAASGLARGSVTDILRGRSARPTAEVVAKAINAPVEDMIASLRVSENTDSCSRKIGNAHSKIHGGMQ